MKLLAPLSFAFLVACSGCLLHAAPPSTNAAPAATGAPTGYDFGDFKSVTLTTKAWTALNAKDYDAVAAYTGKCIDTYKDTAPQQQASLKALYVANCSRPAIKSPAWACPTWPPRSRTTPSSPAIRGS